MRFVSVQLSLISLILSRGTHHVRGFSISHRIGPATAASRLLHSRLRDRSILEPNVNTDPKKTYLNDGFVFGLQGSGIERPRGKEPSLVVEGDELETKPHQVALVVSTFAFHIYLCAASIQHMMLNNHGDILITVLQTAAVCFASWTLADFGSGVLHWSVDNYGNGRTPIMGSIIAAFQGHHSAPWTITYREFCNNVYKLCIPFGIPTMLFISFLTGSTHPRSKFYFLSLYHLLNGLFQDTVFLIILYYFVKLLYSSLSFV